MQVWNAYGYIMNWMNQFAKRGTLFILCEGLEEPLGSIRFNLSTLNSTIEITFYMKKNIVPLLGFISFISFEIDDLDQVSFEGALCPFTWMNQSHPFWTQWIRLMPIWKSTYVLSYEWTWLMHPNLMSQLSHVTDPQRAHLIPRSCHVTDLYQAHPKYKVHP